MKIDQGESVCMEWEWEGRLTGGHSICSSKFLLSVFKGLILNICSLLLYYTICCWIASEIESDLWRCSLVLHDSWIKSKDKPSLACFLFTCPPFVVMQMLWACSSCDILNYKNGHCIQYCPTVSSFLEMKMIIDTNNDVWQSDVPCSPCHHLNTSLSPMWMGGDRINICMTLFEMKVEFPTKYTITCLGTVVF